MRVAINNWPPLASHFFCLLLGFCMGGMIELSGDSAANLPKNSIILTVERQLFNGPDPNQEAISPQASLTLLRKSAFLANGHCVMHKRPIKLFSMTEENISLQVHGKDLWPLVQELKDRRGTPQSTFELMLGGARSNLSICAREPQIKYAP